jgi:peptidyl-prolyl cis-trans isomerase D
MSVIQKIRDKYARVAVVLIALALMGFILTDYLTGRGSNLFGGGGSSTTVGKVNGKKIGLTEFENKVSQLDQYQKSQPYYQGGDVARQQNIDQIWNQEVSRILMEDEMSKLGITVGKRELNDLLFGANPPDDIRKAGTDPQTGQFNPVIAQQAINDLKSKGTKEQIAQFNEYLAQLRYNRMTEKFTSLLSNSVNFPRWMVEKQIADNSLMAKISMVKEVYTSISDSSIKISDKEIEDYIKKNEDDYQQEETRSIAYVTFSALPSAKDSLAIQETLRNMKAEFDSASDMDRFFASKGLENRNYNGYIAGKEIRHANKDSIFKIPVGSVYGPYLDGSSYVLAKLNDVKTLPEKAKARHILVQTATQNQQTGVMEPTRDTAEARKMIDSIRGLILKGENFDSVAKRLSDDGGSKDKGGVYDSVTTGQMVAPFNEFIFNNPVGTKGIVYTEFGFHYMEVLKQYGSATAYKITYLPVPITASTTTDQDASNDANFFAGNSRDLKAFNANYEKELKPKGITKLEAKDIKPSDYQIMGLGTSRKFVKAIYETGTGKVLEPEKIGDNYVVAVVTEVNKKGRMSLAKARPLVEPLLRNKKKAEMFKAKVGKVTTLEAASTALGKPIEALDSIRMTAGSGPIYEPRVNGAAFNSANKGKVVPEVLEGRNGVYVIRVEDVIATPVGNANIADNRRSKYEEAKRNNAAANNAMNALRAAANIVDKRNSIPQL